MGNLLSGQTFTGNPNIIPPLLEETQIFALWTISDVRELLKRFQTQIHGFAIVEAQFEMILSFKPEVADHVELEVLFDILDNDHDGRMDGLEFLGGLALCCTASFEEKCRFCFELFDFNLNSLLSQSELVMMMMSSLCGMNLLTGGDEELEPDLDTLEALAEEAILRGDINSDGQISYEEFVNYARSNREIMAAVEALNRIALDAKLDVQSDDSAPQTDDEGESEELAYWEEDEFENPIKPQGGDQSIGTIPWIGQIQEPTNFKPPKDLNRGPKTNLELVWTYGFNCKTHSNNVRYLLHSTYPDDIYIVYTSAAVCVVYDANKRTQLFYLGHKVEVTAIEIHPNQQIVATADKDSNVHIWTLDSNQAPTAITVFSSMVKNGIQQLKFSPSGDRLAVIGMDVDHTICLHNSLNGEVIASGKGISNPNNVNDIAFSQSGSEIIMVGKQQIRFYINTHTNKRSLEWRLGRIGKIGKRQQFYSCAYLKEEAVVGCGSGEIYKFRDCVCTTIIQAHGIKEAIYCLYYNSIDSVLFSGGKDSMIKSWDTSLKEIGIPIDLCEDLNGDGKPDTDSINSSIRSIQQVKQKILIGTLGCDIFEAVLTSNAISPYTLGRVSSGHSKGELWGLDCHPSRDEFCTVGDDLTIRLWSLRTHEQINCRLMPDAARAVAYSPSGNVICVGMMSGEVSLIEATSPNLRAYSTWRHSEHMISDLKFSPDGNYLAVASSDTNIYIYKTVDQKNYIRSAVCRGHSGAVTHIDFSANSQYLQSNATDFSLLYWNLTGNQITHSFSMRDVAWATNSCVFGWAVQGIWSSNSDYSDVNCCLALPELGAIVTGDDYHKVNLYSYPSTSINAVRQSYTGHSGEVTAVKCSWNKRYIISTGGADETILLWRHFVELEDSDDEEIEVPVAANPLAGFNDPKPVELSCCEENPSVAPRSLIQEAANLGWSVNDLRRHIAENETEDDLTQQLLNVPVGGDQTEETPQWRSKIIEPSAFQANVNSTDVDLELKWIHGHRCHDCRNNVIYSSDGSVVYNAANVAVLYHKPTGKQKFLLGHHVDEVISIAVHPAGQIFATGEAGRKANIVIWNSTDMTVLAKLEDVHSLGVPLLAFNTNGNYLASIGLDSNNTLSIHDWNKGLFIVSTPTCTEKILCCCFLLNDQLNLHHPKEGVKSGYATGRQSRASARNGGVGAVDDLGVSFDGKDVVVTGGEKGFLKFWWWQGSNISSQGAFWGNDPSLVDPRDKKSTILSVASTNSSICVTGLANGNLLIWKDCKLVGNTRLSMDKYLDDDDPQILKGLDSTVPELPLPRPAESPKYNKSPSEKDSIYPHRSPILAIHAIRGSIDVVHDGDYSGYELSSRYITGDKNGVICVWRLVESTLHASPGTYNLVLIKRFDMSQFDPKPTTKAVKSLSERDGLILIGNNCSEIFEVHDDIVYPVFHPASGFADTYGRSATVTTLSKPTSHTNSKKNLAIDVTLDKVLPPLNVNLLSSGHGTGELWGLAIHPIHEVFFTAGDDNFLKCWSLLTNGLISFAKLPDKSRALAIKPKDEAHLAVALNSGDIVIINTEVFLNPDDKPSYRNGVDPSVTNRNISSNLKVLENLALDPSGDAKPDPAHPVAVSATHSVSGPAGVVNGKFKCLILPDHPTQWSQVLKYSFDGQILAAGSHDHYIYLYQFRHSKEDHHQVIYSFLFKIPLHTASVTHIDFGISLQVGKLIQDSGSQVILDPVSKEMIGHESKTVTELYDEEANVIRRKYTTQKLYFDASLHPNEEFEEEDKTTYPVTLDYLVGQSTSNHGELFFWRVKDGSSIDSPNDIRDVVWKSFTCPYGWPIQGIYDPSNNMENINSIYAVSRSHTFETVPVLAIGDIFGRLRLFNYPCVSYGAPDKTYKAHSGKITNIEFSDDDVFLISTGGTDRCIMVWQTDIQDEIRSRKAFTIIPSKASTNSTIFQSPSNYPLLTTTELEEEKPLLPFEESLDHILSTVNEGEIEGSNNDLYYAPGGGDEFQAIKPWKGVIREPSNYKENPETVGTKYGKLPKAILELKYAYGYRGYDCRNNLFYGSHLDQIIYPTASLGVVFNTKENKQIFNSEHTTDIISLAVHPDGNLVATGDTGKFPKICIWDIHTGTTIRVIKCHKIGVSHVSFHPNDSNVLISCGLDDDRMLVIHNIYNGTILGKSKIGKGISVHILRACPYSGSNSFLTAGKNHLKFWDLPPVTSTGTSSASSSSSTSSGSELSSKTGIYNLKSVKTRTVCACAYLGIDPITGMDDGSLLLWKDRTNTKCIANAHTGAITAMTSIISHQNNPNANTTTTNANTSALTNLGSSNQTTRPIDGRDAGPRIVTGGKDGFIHIWDIQLNCVWTLNLNDTSLSNLTPIVSGNTSANATTTTTATPLNPLFVPCIAQVQALDVKDNLLLIGTKSSEIYEINLIGSSNTNSISSSITNNQFFCHMKGHFQERSELWGLTIHPKLSYFITAGDDMTVRLWDSKNKECKGIINIQSKTRCISYSPDGMHITIGTYDGKIIVLSDDLKKILFTILLSSNRIQCITYSPDGQQLAIGAQDGIIYLLETKSYSCRYKCIGHHSTITAIDYSKDGQYLQSTSSDYELLFWNTKNGQQVNNVNLMKDVQWHTFTCPLGWSVQGIWPKGGDGTDVNCVDRSPDQTLLATGDDSHQVKLFAYPVVKEYQVHHEYCDHSHHVMKVKFSADGKYVFTVGGLDKTILQYEVKY